MNISRGEVSEFHYASSMGATGEAIITIGTANTSNYKIKITDLKMTCGGTARTAKLFLSSSDAQALEFDMPANSVQNLSWEIPFGMSVVASTLEPKRFLASASGTGIKYSVSGYIEK
jgi:hypothetical protein